MKRFLSALRLQAFACLLVVATIPAFGAALSETRPWRDLSRVDLTAVSGNGTTATATRTLQLDPDLLRAVLDAAPSEALVVEGDTVLSLPLPGGGFGRFRIEASPVMDADLAAQSPGIRTFRGQGLDDATASARIDWTPLGFHAMVLSSGATFFIDPVAGGEPDRYVVYDKSDYRLSSGRPGAGCLSSGAAPDPAALAAELREAFGVTGEASVPLIPTLTLRTYRVAVAATGEYTALKGGQSAALAAIATTLNRVNAILEREVAVKLTLVSAESSLIYVDPATDPYTNTDPALMSCENAANLDATITQANYDLGLVFGTTPATDVASIGGACSNTLVTCAGTAATGAAKGAAATGSATPGGDPFDVDDVAHAIGHLLGAHHTFNGTTAGCAAPRRNDLTAFEPGSGSTIMSYAGACGAQNLQPLADDYFHAASLQEMRTYLGGAGAACGTTSTDGNAPPSVTLGPNVTIPRGTPFTLTATDASDPDAGDAVTVNWEELDLGSASTSPATDTDLLAERPIFRSFPPSTSLSRTFPRLADILDPAHAHYGESLPTRSRAMTFGVTARDNHAGQGATALATTQVTVDGGSGPFVLTAPVDGQNWEPGTTQTVSWSVNGTDQAPVSCADVEVSLSLDGGSTFPTLLSASTPNDGTEDFAIAADILTDDARVKVVCPSNVFFNISPPFTVEPTASIATPAAILEGNSGTTLLTFPVTLSQPVPAGESVTIDYITADGTATALDGDYVPAFGTLTFDPGDTVKNIDIAVNGDSRFEADETFAVDLLLADGAVVTVGEGVGTITNDDGPPSFSVDDVFVAEGNSGARSAVFDVTLSAPSGLAATVHYATSDVSAAAGSDYTPTAGDLTFAPGVLRRTVAVPVKGDLAVEGNESFALDLTAPVNATIARTPGTGTIIDDDGAGTFFFASPTFSVREGTAFATITVARIGTLAGATVQYTTLDGSATAGGTPQDYQATTGTLTFAARRTRVSFKVPVLKDAVPEGDETVLLQLSNPTGPNATLGTQSTAVLTITDDDRGGKIQFAPTKYQTSEDAGSVVLTVKRVGGAGVPVTVHYATSPVTAVDGVDYTGSSGDLTFAGPGPATSKQTISVPILQDALPDGAKALMVTLSSPSLGATLGANSVATVTIQDDEPTLEFATTAYSVKETQKRAVLTIKRSGPPTGVATVQYATSDGSATSTGIDPDFAAVTGILTFPNKVVTKTITVPIVNDTLVEGPEAFTVTLSAPAGASLGSANSATVTILDDDATPTLKFSALSYTVNEKTAKALILVRRSGTAAGTVMVDYQAVGGTAQNGGPDADYNLAPGTLTFGPKQVTRTITVPIVDDSVGEGTETVVLALSNAQWTGGTAAIDGSGGTATLQIKDNETTLQFASAAYKISEGSQKATISVRRTGDMSGVAVVGYVSSGGSASAGPDYGLTVGTLTFSPRQALKTFTVPIVADTIAENPETLDVALRDPVNAELGTPSTTTVTIKDNDKAGSVQFNASDYSVDELAGTVTITVKRTGGNSSEATVDFDTSDGTAAAPGDYSATSGTLTFGAGETLASFTVPVNDDGTANAGLVQTVALSLSSPGGNLALGARSTATLWIVKE
jgi:Metallo-peptidase family M12B Reprolysin-like/Calx-beta domain